MTLIQKTAYMNTSNNIFSKFILILILIVGWGGNVWGQTAVVQSISGTFNNPSNNTNWNNVSITPNAKDAAQNEVTPPFQTGICPFCR